MNATSKIRSDIQAMRGFAVLAVVLFHANEQIFRLGYLGVDIFFVISGYVVTPLIFRIFQKEFRQPKKIFVNLLEFYRRRFFRLAPALGFTLTISSFLIFFFGNMQDHLRVARQGFATLLLVGNLGAVRYSGNYFSPNPNPFIHTWSLSVEEQIYLFLPILLILLTLVFGVTRKIQIFLLTFIALISLSIFVFPQIFAKFYNLVGLSDSFDATFYSPFSRIWEFCLGGLAFLFLSEKNTLAFRAKKLIIFILIISLSTITFPKVDIDFYIGCIAITCFSTLALCLRIFDFLPEKIINILVWFGDRSYSIYLVHMPLIYLAKYSPFVWISNNSFLHLLIAIIFTFALGHLSYLMIENRFRLGANLKGISQLPFRSALVFSSILPLSMLLFIDFQVRSNYSGILPKISQFEFKDTHQAFLRGCIDLEFDRKKCNWQANNSRGEILVVGDSQAYAIADGVIKAGNSLGFNVVVSSVSGCPFVGLNTSGAKTVNCVNWQKEIEKYIEDVKPDFVFIANRTNGYLNPDSGWRVLLDLRGAEIRNRNLAIKSYQNALSRTLKQITRSSNAVLIQNIPEPGFIDSNTIISRLLDTKPNKSITLNRFSTDSTVSSMENRIAKSIFRTNVLNSTLTLCPSAICILRESGRNIYMDSWHLSSFGSLKLESQVRELLLTNPRD